MRADTITHQDGTRLPCFVTYSCHLIISQTAGAEADVTRLSIHLGALYFHQRSFYGGTGAQRPNGVSVSVVDRRGSESPA